MKKGNVIFSQHVKLNDNICPYKEITPSKQGSLDLLFHNSPDSSPDLSPLLPSSIPSGSRNVSLNLSSIETENIPSTSSFSPIIDLPKNKGYSWVPDTSISNMNEIIGDINS
ncbi:hypothetical protein O181_028373 [Austropuccinia psidii MF-1]|uniref:Uncharacterized protein n=1 Tax=Austropuccinia psidii MF-1 TaxID=1389203 RepID=A0A9Q3CRE8_9BASI|nr:hypothetical protein [Austropuccinia psidii MF-1]